MNNQELREKVDAWARSPEGQQSLRETAERIRTMREKLKRLERLDHEKLRKPMTI